LHISHGRKEKNIYFFIYMISCIYILVIDRSIETINKTENILNANFDIENDVRHNMVLVGEVTTKIRFIKY